MKRIYLGFFLMALPSLNAQSSTCVCCEENYSSFDFWIGDWKVTLADGSLAGHNTITKQQDGCVLIENWTSAKSGYTGTSTNYFNSSSQQWEQLWIDNQGQILKLKGNRVGHQMILSSDPYTGDDGEDYSNRITWTDNSDGTVRQLWELLKSGQVGKVLFDGLYQPKK